MKFTGKIIWMSPKIEGTSQAGNHWERVEIVVEEAVERYPNALLCSALNDRIGQLLGVALGDMVEVDFDLRVRDFTDRSGGQRKAMDATLYKLTKMSYAAPGEEQQQHSQPALNAPAGSINQAADNDDLPF